MFRQGAKHKVVIDVRGKRILAQLDEKPIVVCESPHADVDKSSFALSISRAGASFDYIRMYEVALK
jgi:hypothetical protein